MKIRVFYQAAGLAAITFFIVTLACNSPEKEMPSYIEKPNTVDENDRKIIIKSYEQGIADLNFIDSSKFHIVDDNIKMALPGLLDLYADLNGNLKGLALNKKIVLEGIINSKLKDTSSQSTQASTEFDRRFIDSVIAHVENEITIYQGNVNICTDADVKEYFSSAVVLLNKQLTQITMLKRKP